MAHRLAYAPTLEQIFTEMDDLFPDAPEAAPMPATLPPPAVPCRTMTTEFPDFPLSDLPAMGGDWRDISWHNDTCPRFVIPGGFASVFVDYADPACREMSDAPRFSVLLMSEGGQDDQDVSALHSDEWSHILDFVNDATADGGDLVAVERAARMARLRLSQVTVQDARDHLAENDDAPRPCPDLEAAMLEVIALHWARSIGIGWHPDTSGADYEPAMSDDDAAAYDSDMELLMRAADPYEVGLNAMERAGLISSEADPCPIHRQPCDRCPASCEFHC